MIQTKFSILRFLRRVMILRFSFWRNWGFSIKRSWHIENNIGKYIKQMGSEDNFLRNMSEHLRILY